MSYTLMPFEAEHAEGLIVHEEQYSDYIFNTFGHAEWEAVEKQGGETFSAFRDDKLIACCGVTPAWPGRGKAWAIMTAEMEGRDMLWVTRETLAFFDYIQDSGQYRRLETTVLHDYDKGHQWARILKFHKEGYLHAYDHEGRDHVMYGRVRYP